MLNTYSEYIDLYLSKSGLNSRPCPGEHHFVSVYLLPRLFGLNHRVPDYINPDGTKGIIGDVVYYKDHEHQFGIEAKLGTIRLTKGEFNEWIVNKDTSRWPQTFIGIGTGGIAVCSWFDFRAAYIASVKEKNKSWSPNQIAKGYGPMKSVNLIFTKLRKEKFFCKAENHEQAINFERSFVETLKSEINC